MTVADTTMTLSEFAVTDLEYNKVPPGERPPFSIDELLWIILLIILLSFPFFLFEIGGSSLYWYLKETNPYHSETEYRPGAFPVYFIMGFSAEFSVIAMVMVMVCVAMGRFKLFKREISKVGGVILGVSAVIVLVTGGLTWWFEWLRGNIFNFKESV
jgi:hypothetical protein